MDEANTPAHSRFSKQYLSLSFQHVGSVFFKEGIVSMAVYDVVEWGGSGDGKQQGEEKKREKKKTDPTFQP